MRALARFADEVDGLSILTGRASAWLYPVLVGVLIVNVLLRYGFSRGFIELEELPWETGALGEGLREAVQAAIAMLDAGTCRVAEPHAPLRDQHRQRDIQALRPQPHIESRVLPVAVKRHPAVQHVAEGRLDPRHR